MRRTAAACCGALALSACTTGAVGTLPAVHAVSPSSGALQLAVGTARIGLDDGSSTVGINVVATYRQANGQSATLQNTPTLSGPIGSGAFGGNDAITGLPPAALHQYVLGQAAATQYPPGTFEFGSLVGVYGYGLAPQNLVDYGDHSAIFGGPNAPDCDGPIKNISGYPYYPSASPNRPDQALPLPLAFTLAGPAPVGTGYPCNQLLQRFPLSTTVAVAPKLAVTAFTYLGGPPAWPSPSGYGTPNGFQGYPAGFVDFATPPVPGVYTLQVAAPITTDGSASSTVTASATLPASDIGAPLPGMPQPRLTVQPDRSALVSLNVPVGVSEAIVFIASLPCSGSAQPARYSLVTHAAGPQTLFLSAALGPPDATGKPTATFCSKGGSYAAVAVGYDYPAREASYPDSTTPTPAITNGDGHAGTADITTSSIVNAQYGAQ